jgi:hypothetical protein
MQEQAKHGWLSPLVVEEVTGRHADDVQLDGLGLIT